MQERTRLHTVRVLPTDRGAEPPCTATDAQRPIQPGVRHELVHAEAFVVDLRRRVRTTGGRGVAVGRWLPRKDKPHVTVMKERAGGHAAWVAVAWVRAEPHGGLCKHRLAKPAGIFEPCGWERTAVGETGMCLVGGQAVPQWNAALTAAPPQLAPVFAGLRDYTAVFGRL